MPEAHLVGLGIAAWLRRAHPWALLHVGAAVAGGSGWALASFLPVAVCTHGEVLREERALTAAFGEEYRRYRASVPRYLPRPGRCAAR
ncbi:hypothetical protein [Streptomyces sp. NPDC046712]|uniref:methyltransferase family protein n=1 Tax=Streptomyces sp. NPDC046712 TaxID=3154802 RepID=UPI0033E40669